MGHSFTLNLNAVAAGASADSSPVVRSPIDGWLEITDIEIGAASFFISVYVDGERIAPANGDVDGFSRINAGDLQPYTRAWVDKGAVIDARGINRGASAASANVHFTISEPTDSSPRPRKRSKMHLPWLAPETPPAKAA